MISAILEQYGILHSTITPFGSGLINHTWKITAGDHDYILQKINHSVFQNPPAIANNIHHIAQYLKQHYPDYMFPVLVKTIAGKDMVYLPQEGYFRLFPFIKNSHTFTTVQTKEQAFEAARKFGEFTKLLSHFDIQKLQVTIKDFHNLSLRYEQFINSIENGTKERIGKAADAIRFLIDQYDIVEEYEAIQASPSFKLRVTHHDTKISNILFDEQDKGICVIDLDTVMPGYFISDVGDMMRTYLSPANEEETDYSKIVIRDDFFKAIVNGYLHQILTELTSDEKEAFVYAGKFMIYMQALRFLSDYLNNDIYYGSKYEGHNFNRAMNQIILLQRMMEKEKTLHKIVLEAIKR